MPLPDVHNQPYPLNSALNDPTYDNCQSGNCDALGCRILNSQNIAAYGAGFYSFFNNYDTSCSDRSRSANVDCQSEIFSIEGSSSSIWVHGLNTVSAANMIVIDGASVAKRTDNTAFFPDTIAYFNYKV
jgi:glucan 1,3-beta-glucosidase